MATSPRAAGRRAAVDLLILDDVLGVVLTATTAATALTWDRSSAKKVAVVQARAGIMEEDVMEIKLRRHARWQRKVAKDTRKASQTYRRGLRRGIGAERTMTRRRLKRRTRA